MNVHQISKPIAPERAQRSEATQFHDQFQLATKTAAAKSRLATVSADGGGRNPGTPSLCAGGNSAMHQPWSFAPMRHDVAAEVETQNEPAVVNQRQVVQDAWGWERALLDEQQRQAEAAAAEAAAEAAEERAALEAAEAEYLSASVEASQLRVAANQAATEAAFAAPEERAALEAAAAAAEMEADRAELRANALWQAKQAAQLAWYENIYEGAAE